MPVVETIGSALLSSALQVAFDRLASRQVFDYFRGRKLDDKMLRKLSIMLLSMNALVDDAEQKQVRDPRVRAWLVAVKDVMLDAEDLLDEIDYELTKCNMEAESQHSASEVRNFDMEIESRMKQVLDDLGFFTSQMGYLGLEQASRVGLGSCDKLSQKFPSTSLVGESVIYGREDDKDIILNWLTCDSNNLNKLSILSVVGMGGLGKTTLAQHVYNDPIIDGKFDVKAWVYVSDEFDVFKVTRKILDTIAKSADDSRELEIVHERLKEKLTGKRFLLIMDDVWNESRDKWEAVKTPLNYCLPGSWILVTTRSKKVASTMQSKEHQLEQLQKDHCWKIFAKHAFQDDDNPQLNDELKEIGINIVEKCKGLPLALKTVGCLLRGKSSVLEWKNVLISKIWDLEDSEIIPALLLSYHHLASDLKRCFAYCALFPKDYRFDKGCLILLWMAENFLQCPQQVKSPEEVGEQYFNELLSRSFFQQLSNIDGTCYVMHDLLNDLAKYVCGDICFRLGVDEEKVIPNRTRHFSLEIKRGEHADGFESLCDAEKLRTFMPTGWRLNYLVHGWHCMMPIHELFSKFNFLRVLSLSHCSSLKDVPDSVGNLKHLRSLDVSHTSIITLPGSICLLYNLQILKLSFCRYLEELPVNLHKLLNLRYLEFMNTQVRKLPAHLGKLKNLQILSSFYVGETSEFSIQQLGELNLHGRLSIEELQNIENPSDALAADLKNKKHLEELELKWNYRNQNHILDDPMKIENLQPSEHLKRLSINNYGGTQFPSWLFNNSLSNMVSLELEDCKYCLCLPPLGLLTLLKDLAIKGLDRIVTIDADFYGSSSSSFTSLETMQFSFMKEWERWECEAVTSSFPRLQHLSIEHCPKLKGHLPEQLLHIQKLDIRNCKQLVASAPKAPEIRVLNLEDCGKLQFDYHLTTNIHTNGCHDFLVWLTISDCCDSLTTLSLDFFPSLKLLDLNRCPNLQMISLVRAHNCLKDLKISKCPQFESFPESMHILLPSLDKLKIEDCPKVESFPDGGLPSNLKGMYLYNCSKLITSLKGALGDNTFLEKLLIGKLDVESFPDQGLLPHSLNCLWIFDCPVLKNLIYDGLCHLSSLVELVLHDCPNLQCLPEEGLPNSISDLIISGDCSLLEHRCQKPQGEDWGKITHIQNLIITPRWYDNYFFEF